MTHTYATAATQYVQAGATRYCGPQKLQAGVVCCLSKRLNDSELPAFIRLALDLLAKRRTLTAAVTKSSDPQVSSGCRSRLAATGNL